MCRYLTSDLKRQTQTRFNIVLCYINMLGWVFWIGKGTASLETVTGEVENVNQKNWKHHPGTCSQLRNTNLSLFHPTVAWGVLMAQVCSSALCWSRMCYKFLENGDLYDRALLPFAYYFSPWEFSAHLFPSLYLCAFTPLAWISFDFTEITTIKE